MAEESLHNPSNSSSSKHSPPAPPQEGNDEEIITDPGRELTSEEKRRLQFSYRDEIKSNHLPPLPNVPSLEIDDDLAPPPQLDLKVAKTVPGEILLAWSIMITEKLEEIKGYQLFIYVEDLEGALTSKGNHWREMAVAHALPLPMVCRLSQRKLTGHRVYFAIRAVDIRGRVGPFSAPHGILV